ncbi:MAG: Ca2+-dependent phosphoinositide-specific phospholipase C [Hymenobacter sp.]
MAAEQSGAQIISTDYYAPSTHFKSPYAISFADGSYFRPNPVNAGPSASANSQPARCSFWLRS